MPHMETPRGQGAAVSGTFQASELELPEYRLNRCRLQRQAEALHRQSPYRGADGCESIIGCMVRVAILRCGGRAA
jgi:hypothetical protein